MRTVEKEQLGIVVSGGLRLTIQLYVVRCWLFFVGPELLLWKKLMTEDSVHVVAPAERLQSSWLGFQQVHSQPAPVVGGRYRLVRHPSLLVGLLLTPGQQHVSLIAGEAGLSGIGNILLQLGEGVVGRQQSHGYTICIVPLLPVLEFLVALAAICTGEGVCHGEWLKCE